MKKLILPLIAFLLFSFDVKNGDADKTVTITFSVPEIEAVYSALGKLPAEQVETLRAKILFEANRQLSDTNKVKPKN